MIKRIIYLNNKFKETSYVLLSKLKPYLKVYVNFSET